jgi:hypothetical protein
VVDFNRFVHSLGVMAKDKDDDDPNKFTQAELNNLLQFVQHNKSVPNLMQMVYELSVKNEVKKKDIQKKAEAFVARMSNF